MSKYYVVIKINNNKEGYLDKGIDGFHIKPQNTIKYDGVEVGHLVLLKPELIENVIKRKVTKKLDAYLKYLYGILEEDDDDTDPDDINLVLNYVQRYKTIIMNRYSQYLDPYYIRSLFGKVKLVEEELKRKIRSSQKQNNFYQGFSR